MNLRSFLRLTLGLVVATSTVRAADSDRPQYYELRVYTTKSEAQQKAINDFWQNAAVPAYNRLGVRPIGVFTELDDSPTNRIWVLIPFNSPDLVTTVAQRLADDAEYQKSGADYLNAPKSDPAYIRFETSLLLAFNGMKTLAVPPSTAEKKPWIFELRSYQSHSEAKGLNKIQMFNEGEISAMHEVGLSPVFFAQTIVGSQMPNLVYMVSGESREEHQKHFRGFGSAAGWKKVSADPQYKDNVSKIISIFLKRTPASQI